MGGVEDDSVDKKDEEWSGVMLVSVSLHTSSIAVVLCELGWKYDGVGNNGDTREAAVVSLHLT